MPRAILRSSAAVPRQFDGSHARCKQNGRMHIRLDRIYQITSFYKLYKPFSHLNFCLIVYLATAALPAPSSSVCSHVLGECLSSSSSAGSACPPELLPLSGLRRSFSRCVRTAVRSAGHCVNCVTCVFWQTQAQSLSGFLGCAVRLFFLAPLAKTGRNGLNFLATAA